jgi:hypothetical protein
VARQPVRRARAVRWPGVGSNSYSRASARVAMPDWMARASCGHKRPRTALADARCDTGRVPPRP